MPDKTSAGEIMRTNLVTVTPDMGLPDVVELLLKHEISGAPVLDRDGHLVGIMSELDCVNHIIESAMNGVPPGHVGDMMTREVETVPPDATLLTLAHIFGKKRYRRLPVIDGSGRLVGQISRRDLMKALHEKMRIHQKRNDGPLYLSATRDSDQVPADIVRHEIRRRPRG